MYQAPRPARHARSRHGRGGMRRDVHARTRACTAQLTYEH